MRQLETYSESFEAPSQLYRVIWGRQEPFIHLTYNSIHTLRMVFTVEVRLGMIQNH